MSAVSLAALLRVAHKSLEERGAKRKRREGGGKAKGSSRAGKKDGWSVDGPLYCTGGYCIAYGGGAAGKHSPRETNDLSRRAPPVQGPRIFGSQGNSDARITPGKLRRPSDGTTIPLDRFQLSLRQLFPPFRRDNNFIIPPRCKTAPKLPESPNFPRLLQDPPRNRIPDPRIHRWKRNNAARAIAGPDD